MKKYLINSKFFHFVKKNFGNGPDLRERARAPFELGSNPGPLKGCDDEKTNLKFKLYIYVFATPVHSVVFCCISH